MVRICSQREQIITFVYFTFQKGAKQFEQSYPPLKVYLFPLNIYISLSWLFPYSMTALVISLYISSVKGVISDQ